jgi:hypothetical protein
LPWEGADAADRSEARIWTSSDRFFNPSLATREMMRGHDDFDVEDVEEAGASPLQGG